MDPHRLARERSLAYHRAVAERLRREPALLDRAHRQLERRLAAGERSRHLAERWHGILSAGLDEVLRVLEDPSDEAAELRHASPFAGVVPSRQRWRIWREVRVDLERCAGRESQP